MTPREPQSSADATFDRCTSVTVDHLRGHPVGVPDHRVALPAVRLAELRQGSPRSLIQRRCSAAIPLRGHQTSQTKIRHHHGLILEEEKATTRRLLTVTFALLENHTSHHIEGLETEPSVHLFDQAVV